MFVSCYKLELDNPNGGKNPNFETSVNAAGYVYCGFYARISSMFTQQLKGNDVHFQPIYDLYNLPDNKLKAPYDIAYRHGISLAIDRSIYFEEKAKSIPEQELELNKEMKLKADEGKLIAASIYSIIIEYYSNAEFYEGRNISPTMLTYDKIFTLLNEITSEEYQIEVNLLKARLLVNTEMYNQALKIINTIDQMNDVDFSITFEGSYTNTNEWQRFVGSRGGYLSADSINIINGYMKNDPRLPFYYVTNQTFNFPLSRNQVSIPLIGKLEGYFLKAELELRAGNIPNAQIAYKQGIEKSMETTGVKDYNDYLNINGHLNTSKDIALEQILKEKYLALFGHPLVFVDYKRTKLPKITEKTSNFPDKWMYFYQ